MGQRVLSLAHARATIVVAFEAGPRRARRRGEKNHDYKFRAFGFAKGERLGKWRGRTASSLRIRSWLRGGPGGRQVQVDAALFGRSKNCGTPHRLARSQFYPDHHDGRARCAREVLRKAPSRVGRKDVECGGVELRSVSRGDVVFAA